MGIDLDMRPVSNGDGLVWKSWNPQFSRFNGENDIRRYHILGVADFQTNRLMGTVWVQGIVEFLVVFGELSKAYFFLLKVKLASFHAVRGIVCWPTEDYSLIVGT